MDKITPDIEGGARNDVYRCIGLLADFGSIDVKKEDYPEVIVKNAETSSYNPEKNQIVICPKHLDSGDAKFEEASHFLRIYANGGRDSSDHVTEFYGRLGIRIGRQLAKDENFFSGKKDVESYLKVWEPVIRHYLHNDGNVWGYIQKTEGLCDKAGNAFWEASNSCDRIINEWAGTLDSKLCVQRLAGEKKALEEKTRDAIAYQTLIGVNILRDFAGMLYEMIDKSSEVIGKYKEPEYQYSLVDRAEIPNEDIIARSRYLSADNERAEEKARRERIAGPFEDISVKLTFLSLAKLKMGGRRASGDVSLAGHFEGYVAADLIPEEKLMRKYRGIYKWEESKTKRKFIDPLLGRLKKMIDGKDNPRKGILEWLKGIF